MIRKFCFVAVALLSSVGLLAQNDEKPLHEIGISYGAGVSLIGDGIAHGIADGIFNSLTGRETTNEMRFGTLSAEYFYHLPSAHKVAFGGIFSFATYGEDVENNGQKEGERKRTYFTLMPAFKYYYTQTRSFGAYSKVAAGAMLAHAKSDDKLNNKTESDSKLLFMWQLSLIGLEAGSENVRGFVELGAGEQGIALVGLRYKF